MREHQPESDLLGGTAGGVEDQHQDAGGRADGVAPILTQAERQAKAKELREEGKTQQEIAKELGVSQRTVSDDLAENRVITEKTAKEPRKVIGYRITQYTKPETAA